MGFGRGLTQGGKQLLCGRLVPQHHAADIVVAEATNGDGFGVHAAAHRPCDPREVPHVITFIHGKGSRGAVDEGNQAEGVGQGAGATGLSISVEKNWR